MSRPQGGKIESSQEVGAVAKAFVGWMKQEKGVEVAVFDSDGTNTLHAFYNEFAQYQLLQEGYKSAKGPIRTDLKQEELQSMFIDPEFFVGVLKEMDAVQITPVILSKSGANPLNMMYGSLEYERRDGKVITVADHIKETGAIVGAGAQSTVDIKVMRGNEMQVVTVTGSGGNKEVWLDQLVSAGVSTALIDDGEAMAVQKALVAKTGPGRGKFVGVGGEKTGEFTNYASLIQEYKTQHGHTTTKQEKGEDEFGNRIVKDVTSVDSIEDIYMKSLPADKKASFNQYALVSEKYKDHAFMSFARDFYAAADAEIMSKKGMGFNRSSMAQFLQIERTPEQAAAVRAELGANMASKTQVIGADHGVAAKEPVVVAKAAPARASSSMVTAPVAEGDAPPPLPASRRSASAPASRAPLPALPAVSTRTASAPAAPAPVARIEPSHEVLPGREELIAKQQQQRASSAPAVGGVVVPPPPAPRPVSAPPKLYPDGSKPVSKDALEALVGAQKEASKLSSKKEGIIVRFLKAIFLMDNNEEKASKVMARAAANFANSAINSGKGAVLNQEGLDAIPKDKDGKPNLAILGEVLKAGPVKVSDQLKVGGEKLGEFLEKESQQGNSVAKEILSESERSENFVRTRTPKQAFVSLAGPNLGDRGSSTSTSTDPEENASSLPTVGTGRSSPALGRMASTFASLPVDSGSPSIESNLSDHGITLDDGVGLPGSTNVDEPAVVVTRVDMEVVKAKASYAALAANRPATAIKPTTTRPASLMSAAQKAEQAGPERK